MSFNPLARRESSTPRDRHVSIDLMVAVGLLGTVVAVKVIWALSDGSILAALSTR